MKFHDVGIVVRVVEDVEEDESMGGRGTEVKVDLEDRFEQQDEEDGAKTLDAVLVLVTQRENGAEVVEHELLTLHRVEEVEHSSSVKRKV